MTEETTAERIAEIERGLPMLRSITHLYEGDELDEHLAAIAEIEADLAELKRGGCEHCYRADTVTITCSVCGHKTVFRRVD